jgi:hypothetical protein
MRKPLNTKKTIRQYRHFLRKNERKRIRPSVNDGEILRKTKRIATHQMCGNVS